ncbi:ABC-2 type transport system permease protein [Chitinophaga sp. CF118]|uniref:ABC transporter permease n=1 Tax=Chitinophaga sp. CF118 TaxID=1884367 RepID=UPI0008EAD6AD|nr:ABC transporter permease [Chitinophaga sp. CF118]SFF03340.1 ABC-2 type transport system permease protein [Chitinophaga sp. CF118]
MRTLKFLLEKEFKQIFRDKGLLPVIFIMPLIQLLIMPLAANFDIKNINLAIVDHDYSPYSKQLVAKIASSGYFRIVSYNYSFPSAVHEEIESEKADLILEFPDKFEERLIKEGMQPVYIAADAINGTKAGLGSNYLNTIIADFNSEIRLKLLSQQKLNTGIELRSSNWFNPHMNYQLYMVPGILVLLVTMVCGFIASLNIVKEKEVGTIEQINVTPVKKWEFILGKLIPFWMIGMIDFTLGLLIGRLVYGIIPVGNLFLLYAFLAVYLVALLGFGLLISTYSDTQLQAMFVAFFFIMIFMLMSGLFISVDNMPSWAKVIARMTPVTYFIDVMRMIVLKGSRFSDISLSLLKVAGFAVVLNGWAILNYRKTA